MISKEGIIMFYALVLGGTAFVGSKVAKYYGKSQLSGAVIAPLLLIGGYYLNNQYYTAKLKKEAEEREALRNIGIANGTIQASKDTIRAI
jgi:hypothetical protein